MFSSDVESFRFQIIGEYKEAMTTYQQAIECSKTTDSIEDMQMAYEMWAQAATKNGRCLKIDSQNAK